VEKKYNKWASRRWMIAIYLMALTGGVLLGNPLIGLGDLVLIALIGFTEIYLMVFTGYETKRKIQREGKENASK
jgi:hypothetical protein